MERILTGCGMSPGLAAIKVQKSSERRGAGFSEARTLLVLAQILEQRLLPPVALCFLQNRDVEPIQKGAAFGERKRVIP